MKQIKSNFEIALDFSKKDMIELEKICSIKTSTIEDIQEKINKLKIYQKKSELDRIKLEKLFISRDRKEKLEKLNKSYDTK